MVLKNHEGINTVSAKRWFLPFSKATTFKTKKRCTTRFTSQKVSKKHSKVAILIPNSQTLQSWWCGWENIFQERTPKMEVFKIFSTKPQCNTKQPQNQETGQRGLRRSKFQIKRKYWKLSWMHQRVVLPRFKLAANQRRRKSLTSLTFKIYWTEIK